MKKTILLLTALLLSVFAGCGGDSNPSDPGAANEPPPGRATIDSLITAYFPYYYSRRDSAKYHAMLLDGYRFQKLPEDPDNLVIEFWDEIEEMRIAGRMFRGTRNDEGQAVQGMMLQIRDLTISPSDDPEEPDGIEWFEVDSSIELRVTIDDQNQPEGSDRLFFEVKSPQTFLVAPDPLSPGDWALVRQLDRAPLPPKASGDASTEETSWGGLKGLFR